MNGHGSDRPSPRLTDRTLVELLRGCRTGPIDDREIARLAGLARHRGARIVTAGHGPDGRAADGVARFAASWIGSGGIVTDVVPWPDDAASWLRHARRFTAHDPDLWIMAGPALGFVQMARRLSASTAWDPSRTLAFSHVAHLFAVRASGPGVLDGLSGTHPGSNDWSVEDGAVRIDPRRG